MDKACTTKELEIKYYDLDKQIAIERTVHLKDKEALATALELQAKEYERRLDLLNHEAQQLKDMQATYVPRELFDTTIKELNKEISALKQYKDNAMGKQSILTVVISVIISLGFLLLGKAIK